MDITGTAQVQIIVEVSTSVWGSDCTVEQVFKQASEEAKRQVQEMVYKGGGRIIGEPKVLASFGMR